MPERRGRPQTLRRRKAHAEQLRLQEEAHKAATAEEGFRLHAEADKQREQAELFLSKAETIEAKEFAAPAKAEKMTVRKVWKHEVTDIGALYRARPEFCVIESRPYVINAEIRGGMHECPGLRIWEEIDTIVRTS